ncbi:unnamed protein product [Caenorhabditis auriculariae]|uniref:DM domain-containing protein n=1 Tax=Caenorhabditis auriculariae TaxID=2777116 RepID=A0A8S1HB89_9PELO|nr:unnamed protein product [Caenorhabditis auriculariae]
MIGNVIDVNDCGAKKSMKRLTCRKCEGHGVVSILKGHAVDCAFKNCQCGTCTSVMSMRANALIRRFRHRRPDQSTAVLKTIRSKNGNMRLRIVPKAGKADELSGTTITYDEIRGRAYAAATTTTPATALDAYSNASSPASFATTSTPSSSLSQSPALQMPLASPTLAVEPVSHILSTDYYTLLQTALLAQLISAQTTSTVLPSTWLQLNPLNLLGLNGQVV